MFAKKVNKSEKVIKFGNVVDPLW